MNNKLGLSWAKLSSTFDYLLSNCLPVRSFSIDVVISQFSVDFHWGFSYDQNEDYPGWSGGFQVGDRMAGGEKVILNRSQMKPTLWLGRAIYIYFR